MISRITFAIIIGALALSNSLPQGGGAKERVAALKRSLQQSQTQIRKYEWIETTVVSLKGEEKSRKQNRCYYGADGRLQKVPIGSAAPAQSQPRGRLRGRIVAKKTEELTEYMQQAVQLVHQYLPPDPARLQAANDANKITFQMAEGQTGLMTVSDYLQPGDALSLDIDLHTNTLQRLRIGSYLNKKDDAVTVDARLSTLPDGTSYPALITLDAKAKGVRVNVENSGYRLLAP